jgi:hypothetical protein
MIESLCYYFIRNSRLLCVYRPLLGDQTIFRSCASRSEMQYSRLGWLVQGEAFDKK